jgi:alpha-mannosidase
VAVRLESDAVRLDVDDRGRIASFFDKRAGRELVAAGESIGLQAFRDEPRHWEAWDIDPAYETKPLELFDRGSVEVLERGPLRWRARVELRAASGTRVVEELLLHRAEPRVDVRMKLVWRERRTLLKAAFPLSLRASRATYEIPFGAIERPTASDAPRERARFEVPGQQWADISARGYGVSLLNDCKYGYDCRGSRLRLTLLRSPRYPHPVEPMTKADRRVTDQGRHELAYALLAHRGTWREAGTVRRAREMNTPPIVIDGDRRLRVPAFLRLDSDHVQLAAVKPADAGAGIVLRLVEAHGRAGTASVRLGFDVGEARQTDLLEDDGRRLAARGRWLRLRFRPFEIRTVRLVPRARGVPRKGRRS